MIIIKGAVLPDPRGGLSAPVDIHIGGQTITSIVPAGAIPPGSAKVVDAGGRIAMPGFIDSHVHGEGAVFDPDIQLAMLRQGITSIVVGQDGVSYAPSSSDHPAAGSHDAFAWASGYFAAINGTHPTFTGGTVGQLLSTYEHATPINVAYLVPHGTVRYAVMGDAARAATRAEIDAMSDLLRAGLDDGACGMSTGLEYVPAAYATHDELATLARILAARGLPHVSHMRGYEEKAGTAVDELVRIALDSGVATHISHFHGPADQLTGYLDGALAQGLDVTFDSYPYLRGNSILSMIALPTWLPIADQSAAVRALKDPTVLALLHSEHLSTLDHLWDRVTLASVPGTMDWTQGMTLSAVAKEMKVSKPDAAVEILISSSLRATAIFDQPPGNTAQSVRTLLRHRSHMAGSDAIYGTGQPHPRGWGSFARLLSLQVRKLGDWTWAEAERHLSGAAAHRFGLSTRGALRPGFIADVILVDPKTINDPATYENPRQVATGIDDVIVAGVPVLAHGRRTGATPGRPIRPSSRAPSNHRSRRGQ